MKNVLIDFSHYDDFNGFGEIARNYIHTLVTRNINDLHFIFILPRKHRGRFGAGYDYIDREDKRSQLKRQDKHIDLWHATDQQFHLRGGDSHTIQLLTVHDCNFMTEKKGVHKWRHILQLKWRVRRSDHLTTISHFVLDDLNQNGFIMGKPVDVIYNGIANDEDMPQQQPSFITDDKVPFFFSVGQIREKKNLHTLVPMMKYFPCDHPRNLTDDQLRTLAKHGGVAHITLYNGFLRKKGEASILDAMAHLEHAIDIMGIDSVGLGTDFDGDGGIRGIADSSEMINFTLQLLRRKYSSRDIQKIWGGNWLRVMAKIQSSKQ